MSTTEQRVLKLWVRPSPGAALEEREALEVERDRGIVGDHTLGRPRHVTIVFEDDWNRAAAEVGRELDPIGRRANVLVSGGDGIGRVKSTIRLGQVRLEIKGVTAPCDAMDQVAPGMWQALGPAGRSGIWGRAVEGGVIRVGDPLIDEPPSD